MGADHVNCCSLQEVEHDHISTATALETAFTDGAAILDCELCVVKVSGFRGAAKSEKSVS